MAKHDAKNQAEASHGVLISRAGKKKKIACAVCLRAEEEFSCTKVLHQL